MVCVFVLLLLVYLITHFGRICIKDIMHVFSKKGSVTFTIPKTKFVAVAEKWSKPVKASIKQYKENFYKTYKNISATSNSMFGHHFCGKWCSSNSQIIICFHRWQFAVHNHKTGFQSGDLPKSGYN